MSSNYPGYGTPGGYSNFQPRPPSGGPPPGAIPQANVANNMNFQRFPQSPSAPPGYPPQPADQSFTANPSRGMPPMGVPRPPSNPPPPSHAGSATTVSLNGPRYPSVTNQTGQYGSSVASSIAAPLVPPPTANILSTGPSSYSGLPGIIPPPPNGSDSAVRPALQPAKVQFFSVGGGSPTPVTSAAPPMSQPPVSATPNDSVTSLSGSFSRMGVNPLPQNPPAMPPSQQMMRASQDQSYASMKPGYNAAPGGYGASYGSGASPNTSNSMPPSSMGDMLPGINEIDMSIQCDPRIMRLTVGEYGGCELVNFGPQGIVRCKRCRTYINPFVSWLNNGRQWRCNVCGMVNDVPTSYFCHLDGEGMRRDRYQRPELSRGSVEIQAPSEYMVRPPVPPVYFFVVDVSVNAVNSGLVKSAVTAIKNSLDSLPGDERTQFGILTFNSSIHFYVIKPNLSQPQMLVVSDINDVFLPCPDDLLVNLSECRELIDSLLDSLPEYTRSSKSVDSAFGPALNAASKVMAHFGGKMVAFCANLPSIGEGKLKNRENLRLLGTDKEHTMLKVEDPWAQSTAQEFSKLQICVDLFLCSSYYIDIATLNQLPSKTGGQLFYYPGFTMEKDSKRFSTDVFRVLSRATAFESVMRVRVTRGLRISNFYGNYFIRGTDLLALPNCTPQSVFAIELGYDEQMLSSSAVSIQTALLYTTSKGERRIRVHNVAIPVKMIIQEIFNSVSVDALCNLLAKQALEVALHSGFDAARSRVQQTCIEMLRSSKIGGGYGGYPGSQPQQQNNSEGVIEAIELMPLYSMALQKNPAFRGGAEIRPDERAYYIALLQNMSVDDSRAFIYPRMFSLHDMPPSAGLPAPEDAASTGASIAGVDKLILLPPAVNLSAERLTSDGIFLLENGISLCIWIGRSVNRSLVNSLFGVPSIEGADVSTLRLIESNERNSNDICARVNSVVDALQQERSQVFLPLEIMGEGDGQLEYKFFWHLVEDRAPFPGGGMSYAEYMQNVTRLGFGAMG